MPRLSTRDASPWLVLVIVCFAQFMVVLDATISNVALPSIQADLGFSEANLQWVVNGYTLLFGGFLLLGGRAADLLGRRRLFVAGVALFTVSSLGCALATSEVTLIVARAFQGLGAALVSPAALSIITTTFAEGTERTRALAIWGGIAAGGSAVGLLLGGVLTQALSWEWVFLVNIPVGLGVIAVAMRFVPESRAEGAARSFDLTGAVTVTAGLLLLVFAIVKAERAGWASLQTLGLGAIALTLLAGFLVWESRRVAPLVRLGIFRIRTLAAANAVMLLVVAGLFAMFFFATIHLQRVLGYSPLDAGLAFLPVSALILAGSGVSTVLVKRFSARTTAIFGMAVAAGGLLALTQAGATASYWTDMFPALAVMAFGMGNAFVPLTIIATSGIRDEDAGLASGLFNTAQQIGGALGLAILSTLATDRTSADLAELGRPPSLVETNVALVDGFQIAYVAAAGLLALGAVLLTVMLRRRHLALIELDEPVVVAA
ncbi:MAG: MFS transporter [Thermoleophilia bacterium]